jgi:NTE family protein
LVSFSQEQNRPKVGLVLVVVAPKDLLIGVLKYWKKQVLRLITLGTSMGSVIGGLYATGYNALKLILFFNLLILMNSYDFIPRSKFFTKKGMMSCMR